MDRRSKSPWTAAQVHIQDVTGRGRDRDHGQDLEILDDTRDQAALARALYPLGACQGLLQIKWW